MRIDVLSETTLKLTLTESDMEDSRLCYEALSRQDGGCRKALEKLIEGSLSPKNAALAAELLEEESKLLVEAFPSSEGGCFIYLSSLNRSKSKRRPVKSKNSDSGAELLSREIQASPVIFETDSGELLGRLCRCLVSEKKRGLSFESKLFSDGKYYRLALIPLNICGERLAGLMKEFGQVHFSELTAAYTGEYFRLLAGKGAAEICGDLF
ncbi:MAG TPA: hypothetical protein DDX91_01520 [Ruminococcaceae bacterium]|nr:hypothetical protein [Oscillospiraceae bacterium]